MPGGDSRTPSRRSSAGSRPARPSTRATAGRSGSAGRSCPRTARCGPPARSASRRRGAPRARGPHRPCTRPRRRRAATPRCPSTPGLGPAPRRADGCATASSRTSRSRRRCPARPANVSGFAPAAIPTRVISARPRVISPALPLSPKPSPSAAPAAIATMFLRAPHSSTPRTSGFVYSRNSRRDSRATIRSPSAASSDAITADAGRPFAISWARLGPDSAAIRLGSMGLPAARLASAMTSVIRSSVPFSRPLTTDSTSADVGMCSADALDGRAEVRGRHGEDDQVGRALERARVAGRPDALWQLDAREAALVAPRRSDCRGGFLGVAQEHHRLAARDEDREGRSPGAAPDDGDPRRLPSRVSAPRGRHALPPPAFGRAPVAFAGPGGRRATRSAVRFPPRRRGSRTVARSRNTRRIGVPRKPSSSRSRFSR